MLLVTTWVHFGSIFGDVGLLFGSGGSLLRAVGRCGVFFHSCFAGVVHGSLLPVRFRCLPSRCHLCSPLSFCSLVVVCFVFSVGLLFHNSGPKCSAFLFFERSSRSHARTGFASSFTGGLSSLEFSFCFLTSNLYGNFTLGARYVPMWGLR